MTATMLLHDSMLKPSVFRSPSKKAEKSLIILYLSFKGIGKYVHSGSTHNIQKERG